LTLQHISTAPCKDCYFQFMNLMHKEAVVFMMRTYGLFNLKAIKCMQSLVKCINDGKADRSQLGA